MYQHHKAWTHQDFGAKLPSQVFLDHVVTCFIDDAAGIRDRQAAGIDNMTWECDYPHSDTTWPRSPELLWRSLEGVPEDEIHKITYRNAMRHFHFDPFAERPRERCTARALRAEAGDVDLSPISSGGKPPTTEAGRPVTTRDVARQLASAFVIPAE